jgi:hypothetical protein
MVWLDDYERRARLVPGLFLVAPVALVGIMFGLRGNATVALIVGSLSTIGAPVALANFVRHRGLAKRQALYASWGGVPTTILLRTGAAARRAKWRSAVSSVSDVELPPVSEDGHDDVYESAVAVIRSKTRSRQSFGLLYAENKNYGYERNLYGLRALGVLVSVACLVTAGIGAWAFALPSGNTRSGFFVGLLALVGLLILWLFLPSEERTKVTAFKYAEQLLDAAVELQTKKD